MEQNTTFNALHLARIRMDIAFHAAGIDQKIITTRDLTCKSWSSADFVRHFYTGGGRKISMQQTGLLPALKREANRLSIDRPGGFKDQIRREARRVQSGAVHLNFEQYYSFSRVNYAMGDGTLRGNFSGQANNSKNGIHFKGTITVHYSDRFEDPVSIIEALYGSSASPRAPRWLKKLADLGGRPYDTVAHWTESFSDVITQP